MVWLAHASSLPQIDTMDCSAGAKRITACCVRNGIRTQQAAIEATRGIEPLCKALQASA